MVAALTNKNKFNTGGRLIQIFKFKIIRLLTLALNIHDSREQDK